MGGGAAAACGVRRIWSIDRPSSRVWTRIFWVPVAAKYTGVKGTFWPQALSCHFQPEIPQPLQSSRLTSVAEVVPMRQVAPPEAVTLPENCTKTESLAHEFWSALPSISSL